MGADLSLFKKNINVINCRDYEKRYCKRYSIIGGVL